MIIASPLIGPALPVIGFSGILVIIHNNINTAIPAIPIAYHILPHCLIVGTTQNTCAMPPTKIKYQVSNFFTTTDSISKSINMQYSCNQSGCSSSIEQYSNFFTIS